MRPTRRWTKGMFVVQCFCGLCGQPYRCLQRHTGARAVARDQSLLRVLAFDGVGCVLIEAKAKKLA